MLKAAPSEERLLLPDYSGQFAVPTSQVAGVMFTVAESDWVPTSVAHDSVNTACAVRLPEEVVCAFAHAAVLAQESTVVVPRLSVQLFTDVALHTSEVAVPERTRLGVALRESEGAIAVTV